MERLDNKDLPATLAGVVAKHGREMVALVYSAGMASEGVKVLAKHARNEQLLHAVSVVAGTYNEVASSYAKQRGWTEEMLSECDRDITLAFACCVQVEAKTIITGE